jgi:Na+/serine symporter
MTSDARHNALLALGIVFGTALLIGFLSTIINTATAGEAAGALGSVFGGAIGAVGAALAVALSLRGERIEERRKQQEREIQQINAVIVGIGFNLEVLLQLPHDYLLPHREQSYEVFKLIGKRRGTPTALNGWWHLSTSIQH